MFRKSILPALLIFAGNLAAADEGPMPDAGRGELLYSNHCIACHNAQVHWREKKLATDWRRLLAEVRRWQEISGLDWSHDDVVAVTQYLNGLHYRYPVPD